MSSFRRNPGCCFFLLFALLLSSIVSLHAQQTLGTVTGTVTDATGATIPSASILLLNEQTAATRNTTSNGTGSYLIQDLPIGTYTLTITAPGFNTQKLTGFLVQADRTATLLIKMKAGDVSTSIDVSADAQLNTTDPTNGYVLDATTIENTPLGTGSFTQLATMSPGVHADPLAGTGSNTGLGNQNIYANGQRSSSNTFTFNGVMSNNLFNGNSSSQVTEGRATLNTGESFLTSGTIQTNTSISDAIGESLPSPPQQTIAEERVNTSMYDASQGATAGAHIDVTTKSGTNQLHGSAYGNWESSKLNATPFFNNQTNVPKPDLHRYILGAELGGPVVHDRLFFYTSYQYTRDRDQLNSQAAYFAPLGLTADRSATGLQSVLTAVGLPASTPIDPVAMALLQAKLPSGQFLIRNPSTLGSEVQFLGEGSKFNAVQINGNADYVVTKKDTLAFKYYFQHDPTQNPFGSTQLEGFPQQLDASSQTYSLENTHVFSPRLTWEQKVGLIRQVATSFTGQPLTPQEAGINLFGSNLFPGITINSVDLPFPKPKPVPPATTVPNDKLTIGPTSNFSNTGFAQNTLELTSALNYVVGRHSFAFGGNYDFTQLNILNRANQVAAYQYNNIQGFLAGNGTLTGTTLLKTGTSSQYFQGSSNRYYRSPQVGAFAQDQWKAMPKLTVTAGLRYDNDGGLYEKYGNLVNFNPAQYSYNQATDTILNSGLVIAGNNKLYATPGASNSTLTNKQYGFGPRIGVAYSVTPKFIVRSGFGLYYDRGEFFQNFSPSAGGGFNGPFGVTLQPPFVQPISATASGTSQNPFGATAPPIDTNPADFIKNLSNQAALKNGAEPYLFGAYAANNKLPYSENYSLDLQYQLTPKLVADIGYTGNHGVHQTVPLPFNQPQVATPQSPVNGQIYSYGFQATDVGQKKPSTLLTEPYNTFTGGNTDLRVPFIGYSPNSVAWSTLGWSHYDALLVSLHQMNWHGLDYQLSYTWSHSLDASSGFGLFYNGNNPDNLSSGYASSDFDRTHVTEFSFNYQVPAYKTDSHFLHAATSGFGLSGVTLLESGQPYNVYDFTGTVGSIFYASNDDLINPVLPLAPGVSAKKALTGHSGAFVNPSHPNGTSSNFANQAFTSQAFAYPSLQPGQSGVPPCGPTAAGTTACDTFESNFGSGSRNIFRSSFQKRADLAIYKETRIKESYRLRLSMEVFNVTNTPSFDAPNNSFSGATFANPPVITPIGPNNPDAFGGQKVGSVTNPIGSPRQVQFYGIFTF
jgi:Carboxypeptidase regulatory-like domain/TonB dependent receptor